MLMAADEGKLIFEMQISYEVLFIIKFSLHLHLNFSLFYNYIRIGC